MIRVQEPSSCPESHSQNVIAMELWTILRCWCIVYVLAVTFHSRPGTVVGVDAAVSRYRTGMDNQPGSRSGRVLKLPQESFNGDPYDDDEEEECEQLPAEELGQMLGGAYNARYMSIRAPLQNHLDPNSKKRGAEEEHMQFAVDETFVQEISDQPAWEVNLAMAEGSSSVEREFVDERRSRRSADDNEEEPLEEDYEEETAANRDLRSTAGGGGGGGDKKRPWECDMRVKWTDLGKDYFPRFLRTVECAKTRCFYGRFTCQPRSFTVQLLRRRQGRCVRIGADNNSTRTIKQPQYKTGVDGLPAGLRELWVWEERAVNFCCDCAAASSHRMY